MFVTNHYLSFCGTVLSATLVVIIGYLAGVDSHGMMLEPVNRGSLWRYNSAAPKNYNDNAAFCGGFYVSLSLTVQIFH